MTDTLYSPAQISNPDIERALVAMVAIAPELWPDVSHLTAESFGFLRAGAAWAKLSEAIRSGRAPDPREYGEFIGFDPPPIVREFAVEYAARIVRDAYCRAAVAHCSEIAKAAFERDAEAIAALFSNSPKNDGGRGTLETMKEIGERVWDSVADLGAFKTRIKSSGLCAFDAVCGEGLETGTLSILMARPGMGKSAALVQMSDLISESGLVVAVFSKEMTAEQWYRRMACRRARVNWFRFKRGDVPADELKLIQEWTLALKKRETMKVDAGTPQSTQQVYTQCARLTEQFGRIDFVLADHLRLFSDRADNETHRLGKVSWGFKMLAKNLDTRVVCAAQLSRALENRTDKVPDLPDLRDSGEIEENADNVVALYRPQYYDPTANSLSEFRACKVRDGERGARSLMDWEPAYMNFRQIARDEVQEME